MRLFTLPPLENLNSSLRKKKNSLKHYPLMKSAESLNALT